MNRPSSILLVVLLGCSPDPPAEPPTTSQLPPTAQPETVRMLREDLELARDPSDGGGRGWLVASEPERVTVSTPGRWELRYEAGPLGIREGGWLFFQVSPFWGWSTPQVVQREAPGFTEVSTEAEAIELDAVTADQQLLAIRIEGRDLAAGESIRIVYGAGPAGAIADRFAERASRFWFAVDGDGDGIRGLVPGSIDIEVQAGPPRTVILTLPSTSAVGEQILLDVALVDALGNRCEGRAIEIELHLPDGLAGPEQLFLEPDDHGSRRVALEARAEGVQRIRATGPGELRGESNPLLVGDGLPPILWGDLHGHSSYSDGTGEPEDYLSYARDVAALDVVALTDHDHWGMPHLDQTPEMWATIREKTARLHEPGRFVTLLGYEWTNWIYGHRHVLYFEDEGQIFSSIDPRFETPGQLWEALRGRAALTFAHHSAGGPIATDWSFPPHPELEPVTEVVSVHGASEAADAPGLIYRPLPDNFVRNVLDRGHQLGFIGSGDGHDGHPGLAHFASPTGGLAAFVGTERTREGVLESLRSRRVYATNGPRIVIVARLGLHPMGSTLAPSESEPLEVEIVAAAPLRSLDVIRSGQVVVSVPGRGEHLRWSQTVQQLGPGDYLYLRAVQEDGGAAWSSPWFVRPP